MKNIIKLKPKSILIFFFFLIFPICLKAQAKVDSKSGQATELKNVIIMIVDGLGKNQIELANYYLTGKKEAQNYEEFPFHYFMSTYPAKTLEPNNVNVWSNNYNSKDAWLNFRWTSLAYSCSGAAGTAMATGKKTHNKCVGVDVNKKPLLNLTEFAKSLGKSTGVISNINISEAIPAAFTVHNTNRENFQEIAQSMILDSKLDVLIGAGNPDYSPEAKLVESEERKNYDFIGGKELWEGLLNNESTFKLSKKRDNYTVQDCDGDGTPDPWTLVQTKEDILKYKTGDTPKRLLGIPQVLMTLQQSRNVERSVQYQVTREKQENPFTIPFNENMPTLKDLSEVGINALQKNEKGFFALIHCGSVDWACHLNQAGRMVEEIKDFNETVDFVVDWVNKNSNWMETMLIVTASHETGYLTGPKQNNNSPATNPIVNVKKGELPEFRFNSENHSNQLVPFYCNGEKCNIFSFFADEYDFMRGYYMNNSEIAQAIFLLWGK